MVFLGRVVELFLATKMKIYNSFLFNQYVNLNAGKSENAFKTSFLPDYKLSSELSSNISRRLYIFVNRLELPNILQPT